MIDRKKQLQQSPGAPPVPKRGRLRPGILHKHKDEVVAFLDTNNFYITL